MREVALHALIEGKGEVFIRVIIRAPGRDDREVDILVGSVAELKDALLPPILDAAPTF